MGWLRVLVEAGVFWFLVFVAMMVALLWIWGAISDPEKHPHRYIDENQPSEPERKPRGRGGAL